uniref:Poly [ADP-ribose] polymerase 12 n=1 Tax=Magallana gigas TaxID=29159 RepID=K1P6C4_MAGGI
MFYGATVVASAARNFTHNMSDSKGRGGRGGGRGKPRGGSQGEGQQNRYGSHQDLFPGQNFNSQTSLLGNPTNWQPGVPQTNVPLPPYLPGGVGQQIYPGMHPNYPPPNAPGVRAPLMSLPPHQMSLPQQPLTQPPRHDSSAGSAKFESKHPVVKLNDLKPGLKYQDQPTNNDFVCIKKGSGNDQGSSEKKEKAKPKSKLKDEGEDMERIFNDTMDDLKKLTLPDVNVKSKRPPTGNKTMQKNQGGKPQKEIDMGSRGNLKEDTINDDSQSERGGRRRGGRGKRRGKGTKAGEALPGDDGEEDESGNDSDTSHVSQSSRGRGPNRRGRGRGRGGLQPSGSTHDLNVRDDSDNESVCSQTSQSGRGRGGRIQRGGRGRGRGGRGANSQRHNSGGQEGDKDEAENKHQQAALDLGDESDENFSEAKVFRYLVKTLGGCASIQKFKEEFSPLPADFDDWVKTPKNRLSVFKRNEPKAETLPKKRLDRKNRWNTNEEESEPIEITEKVSTNTSVLERDADKKDICPSLIPGSCKEKKCDRHHRPLPYLWQIRIFGTWVSFNDEENEKLERGYCNLEEIGDAEVEHEERKYKIHMKFNENIGVVYEIMHGEESLNTNDVLSSRRLSTASFGKEKKPLTTGSFHTQWRWYYHNDVGQWVPFDKDRFQYTLEKKYVMGQKTYLFTRENYKFKYKIELADWTQVNLDTGKERKILRRPVFVSITDVAAKIYPPIIQVSATGPVPPGWAPWDLAHPFELVELDESCKEYREVKGAMFDTLKEDYFTISNIYRIQNLSLWKEFNMRKTNMEMDHEMRGESVNVKSLFHGTDSIDTCYGICTNNFDFRLSGKNATMYGKGSYFATTAKYSNCYTRGPLRLIFRARVLIGRYTKGEKDIACPPNIPGEGHKRFDSCVDNETNPSIFVVFDRNQSYPEHLIAYRGKDDELSPALSNPAPVSNPVSRPSSLSSLQSTTSVVAQASSSTLGNISQSAQSSPSQLYSGPSSGIGTPQPASSPGVMYSNPYLSSPSSTTSLPGTSRSPSESQSFSYRTASGREQRMSYPEAKKKDETCSIQ